MARPMPLARGLAARYRHTGEPQEDLEQIVYLGLINSIDRYDPAREALTSGMHVSRLLRRRVQAVRR